MDVLERPQPHHHSHSQHADLHDLTEDAMSSQETVRFWRILSGGDALKKERAAAADSILHSRAIR